MLKTKNSELNRKNIKEFKEAEKIPIIIVLDNVRSLHNVGSIFRTADAFLLEGIYLCGITGCPPHREIHKTALGSTESVSWKYLKKTIDAISELKNKNYKIIAVEQAKESIALNDFTVSLNRRIAVVFGNEIYGVEQEVMDVVDDCIEIPQFGTKHSLNIAVSAGIVIWELFRRMKKNII